MAMTEETEEMRKFAWEAALKWGFGVVVLATVSTVFWLSLDKQNAYIRESMSQQNIEQSKTIERNSQVLQQNSEVIKQNSLVMEKALDIVGSR